MTNRKLQHPDQPGNGNENGHLNPLVASSEQAARAVAPAVKCATCANLELVSLAGRRARAYLELPGTVAQCRGPQDLLAAQARFWQTAFKDYAECTQRIAAAVTALTADETADDRADGGRDTLAFPDVFSLSAWSLTDTDQGRRSAGQGSAHGRAA